MRFSFFMMPLHLPSESPSLAFDRDIGMIEFAEELGYDEFFIGEHHTAGWETMPCPEMALAKAAATTKVIKLGSSMVSAPFHHPFQIAERYAMLDHLTKGRAVLGLGPCSLPPDIKLFGLPREQLSSMMAESIDIIAKLLESDDVVTYRGSYWNLSEMAVQLRSYQQPRLKFALATAGSLGSLELAGRYETLLFSLAGGMPPGNKKLSEQWQVVEKAGEKYSTSPSRADWRIVTYVHLAETREEAWREAAAGIERDVKDYFYTIAGPMQWMDDPTAKPYSLTAKDFALRKRWIIGTPDDAVNWIEQMQDETGGFGGVMISTHEWMKTSAIKRSMEMFARYVIPHFRGHVQPLKSAWDRTKQQALDNILPGVKWPAGSTVRVDNRYSKEGNTAK